MNRPLRQFRRALVPLALAGVAVSVPLGQTGATADSPHRDTVQLIRVSAPTKADKVRLNHLGLDLAEAATRTSVDVVTHRPADQRVLRSAGFTWTVLDADLEKSDAERVAADEKYALSRTTSPLPSGRTSYRTLSDYNTDLDALAASYPGQARVFNLNHTTLEGRTVKALEVANNVAARDGRPTFVLLGLHHAREWPSGELTIEFAYDVLKNSADTRIKNILDNSRIVFVPVVNEDGFNVSRTQTYEMKRKDCRVHDGQLPATGECEASSNSSLGTDPNRNYSGFWGGPGASTSTTSETYRGGGPFSEPETQNIQDLVSSRQVTTLITNHTYSNLVLREPGYASAGLTPDETMYKALGDQLAAQNGYSSELGYQLYDTTGTTEDWSYYATGGLAFTFEHGKSSFHPAFSNVVDFYYGSGRLAGKGNREAFLIAAESTINPARHSVITGTAPAGDILRIKKQFSTKTWNGTLIPDTLESTLVVPASGTYTWHVNPSTRPIVIQDGGGTESWTLTCERPDGTVTQTQQVTVARGASATANCT
jgi:carboxypeptidase T